MILELSKKKKISWSSRGLTKNMILRHLKDIKAEIEQKSIHNMKLPLKGPFKIGDLT